MIEKRIKKIVEEIILKYQQEFSEKFSKEEMKDALKHKTQIANLALSDSSIEYLIKDEVEDCVGAYLLKKQFKKNKI